MAIVKTLMHKAMTLTGHEDKRKREEKVKDALRHSGYPEWAPEEGEVLGNMRERRVRIIRKKTEKCRREKDLWDLQC